VIVPKLADVLTWLPQYGWFVGCGGGFLAYYLIARASSFTVLAHAATAEPVETAAGPAAAES
jgi:NCS1 family nucleobase:cation symporter-1